MQVNFSLRKFSKINRERSAKIFPKCETWFVSDWIVAILGELGEASNAYKKIIREDKENSITYKDVAIELVDVITYCDQVITRLGYNTEDLLVEKFDEVSIKRNYPLIQEKLLEV